MTLARTSNRDISVFINCPFDGDYEPLFDALIFSAVCCGFIPLSSAGDGTAEARMERIHRVIASCKYSIHDLSRCRGEGDLNFARFNMPLELGIALGHARVGPDEHEWFGLALSDTESGRYISDLLGYDLKRYDGTPGSLVNAVMAWLLTRQEAVGDLTPRDVLGALPEFSEAKCKIKLEWAGAIPWSTLLKVANSCVPVR